MERNIYNYYTAISDVAKVINSTLDIEEVLKKIVEGVMIAASAKGCSLMLLSRDREILWHTVSYGLSENYERKGRVFVDVSIAESLKGNAVAVLNATEDDRIQYRDEAKKEGIASILCVPVMIREKVIGVMRLYTVEQRHFDTDDVNFLGSVANLVAIVLEKERLRFNFRTKFGLIP